MVGEVTLQAGQTVEVVIEFCNRPAENPVFSGLRVGIGRPLGDADIAEAARVAAAADRGGTVRDQRRVFGGRSAGKYLCDAAGSGIVAAGPKSARPMRHRSPNSGAVRARNCLLCDWQIVRS